MVRRWVNRLVPYLTVWWIGWLVFWFGSGVWSMGRLAIGSIVRLFGGTVVRCVCRLFCGRLEDWSVRLLVGCLVSQSVIRIVRGLFGWWIGRLFGRAVKSCAWSVGLALGQWMDWLDG